MAVSIKPFNNPNKSSKRKFVTISLGDPTEFLIAELLPTGEIKANMVYDNKKRRSEPKSHQAIFDAVTKQFKCTLEKIPGDCTIHYATFKA